MRLVPALILLLFSSASISFAQEQMPSFEKPVYQAFAMAVHQNNDEGLRQLREMKKQYPDNPMVTHYLISALDATDRLDEAIEVAVQEAEKSAGTDKETLYREWAEKIKVRRDYEKEEIKKALPWQNAVTFGNQQFIIRTNVPTQYHRHLIDNFIFLDEQIRQWLNFFFQREGDTTQILEIKIPARAPEHEMLWESAMQGKASSFEQDSYDAYGKQVILFFYGEVNWHEAVYRMTHAILRKSYVKEPSMLLAEGLALSLANRLARDENIKFVGDQIEFINWRYNNGMLDSLDDIFTHWREYEYAMTPFGYRALTLYQRLSHHFFNDAWSFILFFIDTEDPAIREILDRYLEFEQKDGRKTSFAAKEFFMQKLTEEEQKFLENAWLDHALQITFETV